MLHINMVAALRPPPPPPPDFGSQKVEIQLFRNMVMLDIKLTGIINAATWQQIFCPQNLSFTTLGAWSKGQNSTFSEQYHVAYHPKPLGMGSIGHNSFFSEHGHVAYQTKENQECSNMVAYILPAYPLPPPPPPPTLGMGSIGQNSTFSEHCHVPYQIIENHECSNMVANILLADPLRPPTLGMELIFQNSTFSEHGRVAYQINGNHETQQHVSKCLVPRPPPHYPRGWGQKVKVQLFQNMVMLHIKSIGIRKFCNMVANIFPQTPPPPPRTPFTLGVKRLKFNFFRTWLCWISN